MNKEKNFTNDEVLWLEANERMELMGIPFNDRNDVLMHRKLSFKVVVNDEEKSIRKLPITEEEFSMIKKFEEKYEAICYYLSMDQGILPEDLGYSSYTIFYVSNHPQEYEMIKESIKYFEMVPAFVVNVKVPEHSELGECKYKNIKGLVINVS